MDAQTWRNQFFDLESQVEQNEKRIQSSRAPRDKRNVKSKLPQLSHTLDTLDTQLTAFSKSPAQYGLNQSEINSLISKMNSLRNKISSLDALCNKGDENTKSALLGDHKYRNIKDSDETIDMTNQQLFTDHKIQQANQDAKLDNISDGLSQLNTIAVDQNRKLIHHGDLMQDLDQNMDIADENMRTNIRRADIVEENSSGGWFSLLIMIALLGLILFSIFSTTMCSWLPGAKC
jgi:predicted RNase H-like nuclease (RuvC/YqgF family)